MAFTNNYASSSPNQFPSFSFCPDFFIMWDTKNRQMQINRMKTDRIISISYWIRKKRLKAMQKLYARLQTNAASLLTTLKNNILRINMRKKVKISVSRVVGSFLSQLSIQHVCLYAQYKAKPVFVL